VDFLKIFSVKFPISNFTQTCPVGAALIHAGRWTDVQTSGWKDKMKIIGAFVTT